MLIMLIPSVYMEIYIASMYYGINGYISVLWIMTTCTYLFAAAQTFNIQDFILLLVLVLGPGKSFVLGLYNFAIDNHPRLVALRKLDNDEENAAASAIVDNHGPQWRNFLFAVGDFVLLAVILGLYAGTSLLIIPTTAGRFWVILTNYLVWGVGMIMLLIITAVRYSVNHGDGCMNLRKFSTFDIANLVIMAIILLVLAIAYIVAAVVGQSTDGGVTGY